MNDEQSNQPSALQEIIEGAKNAESPVVENNDGNKVLQSETPQPENQQPVVPEKPLVTEKTLVDSKTIAEDVDIIKGAIGQFDEAKLKGYLMSNLGITGTQADDVVDAATFQTKNEMMTLGGAKWELYSDRVIEKAVGAIYEYKVQQMEMQDLARNRDIAIGIMGRELFGSTMADRMVEEAEENYSKFTHVPKDQIRDLLPVERYKEMLTQFQMSPKYMEAIHKVHNDGFNESEDAARKFLKSAGFEVKQQQQKTHTYIDFLKGEIDNAKKNVLSKKK